MRTCSGSKFQLGAEDLELLRVGSLLHDIGKIGIGDDILRKPDTLSADELEAMKTHVARGVKTIEQVPGLREIVPIVRSHHERWDGLGYPDGLRGEEIPCLARLVAVAEAFDAMVYDTPYRRAQAPESACAEIESQAGRQFDPAVVAALVQVREKLVEMHRLQ